MRSCIFRMLFQLYEIFCMNIRRCIYLYGEKWGKREGLKSFAYLLDRMLPGDECGAWHSADLWYWFGTLKNCWRPMEQKDYDLSDQMTTYLCNFAKFGDPNGENLPDWTPTSDGNKMLILGEKATQMGKPNMLKLAKTMLTNKAVGE